jgi:hypothetical protein
MKTRDTKEAIVSFARSCYKKHRKPPSIRLIARRHRGLGVTRSNIYKLFPGGLAEICRKAGVPTPKQRIKATQKALKARKAGSFEDIKLLEEKVERLAQIVAFLGGRVGGEQLIFEDEHWDELWERYENLRIEKK